MNTTKLLCSSAIFAGLTFNAAHAQQAESNSRRLDPVVVTTQKIDQNLLEVPINVSAVDQNFIDLVNADDLEELADFIPGLQVQAQSLNAPSFSIRGVTSDGGSPRVAIFTNGVSNARPGWGASLAYFDMERIEVVKGPQPTLFGQGALVGGINFIQNTAKTGANAGYAEVEAGSNDLVRLEAAYNYAITDEFAVRIAGVHDDYSGYIDNADTSTPDLMGQKTDAFRVSAFWAPIEAFEADLIINYEDDESTGTEFRSAVIPTGSAGNLSLNPYDTVQLNHVDAQGRDELGSDREIFSTTAILNYQFNDNLSLTSITDYRDQYQQEAFDSDGTSLSLLQFGTDQKAKIFTQELRLNFDDGDKLRGFVGVNYFDEEDSTRLIFAADEAPLQALAVAPIFAADAFGGDLSAFIETLQFFDVPNAENVFNPLNPVPISLAAFLTGGLIVPLDDIAQNQYEVEELTSVDFFGDISYDVTEKLTLTAGVRYTDEEYSRSLLGGLIDGNDALGGQLNGLTLETTFILPDTQGQTVSRTYDADGDFTWRVAANYELAPEFNGWASIARGRRPGGLEVDAADATGFAVIDPEFLNNYEVGLKGEFLDNRLRLTSSIYYSEYEDFQVTFRESGNPIARVENTGAATQYGFEVDAYMIVNDYLDVFATYGYNFSEFDDSDSNGNAQVRAGNTFRISPENTFSLGALATYPVGEFEVFAVPTYVWKDEFFFSDENRPVELQDAYGLLDLKIGVRNDRWSVSAYVENATDEEYLIDYGNTGDAFGIPTTIRGIPRWYGVEVRTKF